jgi:hypothetical protein
VFTNKDRIIISKNRIIREGEQNNNKRKIKIIEWDEKNIEIEWIFKTVRWEDKVRNIRVERVKNTEWERDIKFKKDNRIER